MHLTLGLDHAIFGLDRFSLARALAARGGSRLEVDDAVALPFWAPMNVGATLQYLGRNDIVARDVAVAFAAHAYRLVEAQARLYDRRPRRVAGGVARQVAAVGRRIVRLCHGAQSIHRRKRL